MGGTVSDGAVSRRKARSASIAEVLLQGVGELQNLNGGGLLLLFAGLLFSLCCLASSVYEVVQYFFSSVGFHIFGGDSARG